MGRRPWGSTLVSLTLGLVIATVPTAVLGAPQIALFPPDRTVAVIESRPGSNGPLKATVPIRVLGESAKNLTFALAGDPIDKNTGVSIPAGSITIEQPAGEQPAGRLTNVTLTFSNLPGPGRYPIPLYAFADGMAEPQPINVELNVAGPPRLLADDPKLVRQPDDSYQATFAVTSPYALTGVTFTVKDPVPAAEGGGTPLQPSQVRVVLPDGETALPGVLKASDGPVPLVVKVRPSAPGTYQIPLTMTADGLATPASLTFTLVVPAAKMDPLPSGYTLKYMSPWSYRGPAIATWLSHAVSGLFGTDSGGPCDRQIITYRTSPPDAVAQAEVHFGAFSDTDRGRVLANASPVLRPVDEGTCADPSSIVTFHGEGQRQVVIDLQPAKPGDTVRPGTYRGQLYTVNGTVREAMDVTIQVRHGVGVAIICALLGLAAQWLVGTYRKRRNQEPSLRQLEQLRRTARRRKAPLLVTNLIGWVGEEIRNQADQALVDKELTLAATVVGVDEYLVWARQFDGIGAENVLAWKAVRACCQSLAPDAPIRDLHNALVNELPKYDVAVGDITPPQELLKLVGGSQAWWPRVVEVWHWLAGELSDWFQVGWLIWVLRSVRAGLFIGAMGATVLATVAMYKGRPDFGANMLSDYGSAFGLGYIGKEFNNFLQAQLKDLSDQGRP